MTAPAGLTVDGPIFGKVTRAVEIASRRGTVTAIYLGVSEWQAMRDLCEKWGLGDWPPGSRSPSGYQPEVRRAMFSGIPIFRVDAQSHLAAVSIHA